LATGRSQPWTSECKNWGATGAIPPRLFILPKFAVETVGRNSWSKFSGQKPQTLTNRGRWPRRVSAIRSPPLQAELP
jgi:hypothetical protein